MFHYNPDFPEKSVIKKGVSTSCFKGGFSLSQISGFEEPSPLCLRCRKNTDNAGNHGTDSFLHLWKQVARGFIECTQLTLCYHWWNSVAWLHKFNKYESFHKFIDMKLMFIFHFHFHFSFWFFIHSLGPEMFPNP